MFEFFVFMACLFAVSAQFVNRPKFHPESEALQPLLPSITNTSNYDCLDVLQSSPAAESGLYVIHKEGLYSMTVYCDMEEDGGGWTVFQRRNRSVNNVNFSRNWTEYEEGFGNLEGEFWLGNRNLYYLANPNSESNLSVTLEQDFPVGNYTKMIYTYGGFYLKDSVNYALSRKLNSTTYPPGSSERLHYHAGYSFSTHDRPGKDGWFGNPPKTCSERWGDFGGWWYNSCFSVQLNAGHYIPPAPFVFPYGPGGVRWFPKGAGDSFLDYTLATIVMKICRSM